jgi:hypothetical protein
MISTNETYPWSFETQIFCNGQSDSHCSIFGFLCNVLFLLVAALLVLLRSTASAYSLCIFKHFFDPNRFLAILLRPFGLLPTMTFKLFGFHIFCIHTSVPDTRYSFCARHVGMVVTSVTTIRLSPVKICSLHKILSI